MGKIRLLDPSVSELIAAGEVIERPASIIKELLENCIDAGATAITVEIRHGGISYLRVTDNGIGIEAEDVPTAFLRHATSKVWTSEDLSNIATLGFRGEALASICAVSKLELITKVATAPMGTCMTVHGGVHQNLDEIGCANGTTIVVQDLFYNMPARLKFLKKDVTEGNAVQGIVEKIALSHPHISFRLLRDGKQVLHSPGNGDLRATVYAILGGSFAKGLLAVDYTHQGIAVKGFITAPDSCRKNRMSQYLFVNDRYVKSGTSAAALDEAYRNAVMVGKFPGCVLMLYLPFDQVDVNVHPAKIEVRFAREKLVFEAIFFAVKSALDAEDLFVPAPPPMKTAVTERVLATKTVADTSQMTLADTALATPTAKTMSPKSERFTNLSAKAFQAEVAKGNGQEKAKQDPFQFLDATSFAPKAKPVTATPVEPIPTKPHVAKAPPVVPEEQPVKPMPSIPQQPVVETAPSTNPVVTAVQEQPVIPLRLIGELFKTYILFEVGELFVMLDKHAAHERILFDRLKEQVSLKESQMLLQPHTLSLSAEERGVLQQEDTLVQSLGFLLSFHGAEVVVLGAPMILHRYSLQDMVEEIADNLLQKKMDATPSDLEELLHSMACRAAMKANDANTPQELAALARQVYNDRSIKHCPHGRPVGVAMTKYEVEKKFGRV